MSKKSWKHTVKDTQSLEISLCLDSESLSLSKIVSLCVCLCAGEKEDTGNGTQVSEAVVRHVCPGKQGGSSLMGLVHILQPLLKGKGN